MENKKPIIIALIVLVIVTTLWLLVGEFKDLKIGSLSQSNKTQSNEAVTTKESVATQGVVTAVTGDKVTVKNEIEEKTIEATPETTIYVMDETGLPIETKITDVKKDAKALVIHKESITRTKVVASNITQGSVTEIADGKISIQTADEGTKIVDISSNPTIYMGEGDQAVDMQASDIKSGSEITVAYADAETKLQVVGIRIDKL